MHLPYFNARNYDSGPILVIANHISGPVKEELRKAKINYVDVAGNIYIDDAPILIYIDGLKRKQLKETNKNRAFTKTGLKIVFAFLKDPQRINLPYRVIADELNVALDTVHNVINGLKEMGFIISLNEKKNKVMNLKQLLESGVHEVSLGHITTDLDIAVLIDNEEKFSLLKNKLVNTGRFTSLKNSPYTLLFDCRIQLDLLPFGGVNIEDKNFSKTIALTYLNYLFPSDSIPSGSPSFDLISR